MEGRRLVASFLVGIAALGLVVSRREKPEPRGEMPSLPAVPKFSGLVPKTEPVHIPLPEGYISRPVPVIPASKTPTVSDAQTLDYQLDRIIDDLQHLETEHLPAMGIIAGAACDCISKSARSLRFHSQETIPIAARQGKDARIFAEMAQWADHFVKIGTQDEVSTGTHTDEYLRGAGEASAFRKRVNAYVAECKPCQAKAKLAALSPEARQKIMGVAQKVESGEMTLEQAKTEVAEVIGG